MASEDKMEEPLETIAEQGDDSSDLKQGETGSSCTPSSKDTQQIVQSVLSGHGDPELAKPVLSNLYRNIMGSSLRSLELCQDAARRRPAARMPKDKTPLEGAKYDESDWPPVPEGRSFSMPSVSGVEDSDLFFRPEELDENPHIGDPEVDNPVPDHIQILMWNARAGNRTIIKILLERGDDINARDIHIDDNTALIYAATFGESRVIDVLLGANAQVDAQNVRGHSALMAAALNGHLRIVQKLVNAGANIMLKDSSERTALSLAQSKGHSDIVSYLESMMPERAGDETV